MSLNWNQLKTRDAQRRKLALGKAIMADGPLTGGQIGLVLQAANCPVEYPEEYPKVLVQHKFLVAMGTVPQSYYLTPKGRNFVEALVAGENYEPKAKPEDDQTPVQVLALRE